ncbi:MAG: hypothetical protein ABJC89_23485 [Acidobacteriota bacterium]
MFPLNWTLWSSPFVVLVGGAASLLLAIRYATAGGPSRPENARR